MGVDVTHKSLAVSDLSLTGFPGQGLLNRQLTDMRARFHYRTKKLQFENEASLPWIGALLLGFNKFTGLKKVLNDYC